MKRVVVLQHRLLHYRVRLFDMLREACKQRDIDLELMHGLASNADKTRNDEGQLPWARVVKNHYFSIGGRELIWQRLPSDLLAADMIVMMQENRILSNYPLLIWRKVSQLRLAYWGHGRNFQSIAPTGFRERWKLLILKQVDWWFPYTSISTDIVVRAGFPREHVSQLDNAIDNSTFEGDLESWSTDEISAERGRLGIPPSGTVAIFCGSLYPDKRLDLMVEAGDILAKRYSEFVLLVLGDGPSTADLRRIAVDRPWLRLLGTRKGRDKALYFRMSSVMLNPGAVGLHVVDAFCAGVVLVTTADALHGPEIAYLEHGINGLICSPSAQAIAGAVTGLIDDPVRMRTIQQGAHQAAGRYTLQSMLNNFVDGLVKALKVSNRRTNRID